MRRILIYMKKYWYCYFGGILLLVLGVALDMFAPIITQRMIDEVIKEGRMDIFLSLVIGLASITAGRAIFGYFKEIFFDVAGINIAYGLRKHLFDHIQGLSLSFFDKKNTGELMTRIKEDVDKIWHGASFGLMLVVEVCLYFVIATVIMFRISPKLALISILTVPIIGYLAARLERRIGDTYEKISEENAKLNTIAQENIAGVRLVKAFAREKYEINKFLKSNKTFYEYNMKQAHMLSIFFPKMQAITDLLPIMVVVLGGALVVNEQISIGTLVAFVAYIDMIVMPMRRLGWLSNLMAEAIASTKKINGIFDEVAEVKNPEQPIILDQVKGSIEFNHVHLSLNNTEILKDINFKIEPGKTLGIMGETGSGKSSIIHSLLRFYDVTQGQVTIDGKDIRTLDLKQVRGNISVVMQDVFLFSDTIEENIKLGNREVINEGEMVIASQIAQSNEFIERMESRFDTVIGERGIGLSGGQKQRISMTRALARKCPILVFDDSTSALDMETEFKIQKSIDQMKEVTKIIIAHRISSVKNADEIIVLDQGEIIERGTHDALMALKGRYYATYLEQYEGNQAV